MAVNVASAQNLTEAKNIFESNITLLQVTKLLNINISNLTQLSAETQMKIFDLYQAYRTNEKEEFLGYKFVAYILGTLIILSNLSVVISSGLILKKGQQPKSTYLLLGNVSLADTIIGFFIVFGTIVNNSTNSDPLCVFQIGMLVCPGMVSIFSVGLIAIDRYIYILHGMYYQRWFNTTKVRIGILCIWMIGIILGFIPATGYINPNYYKYNFRCNYVSFFPESIILLNSFLSIISICLATVLYFIILSGALKQVRSRKASGKSLKYPDTSQSDLQEPKLRIFRGNANPRKYSAYSVKDLTKVVVDNKKQRRASFTCVGAHSPIQQQRPVKSKSSSELIDNQTTEIKGFRYLNPKNNHDESKSESVFSITTITSSGSEPNIATNKTEALSCKVITNFCKKRNNKPKEPNKWRAITVIMLTSGSFIVSWLPVSVTLIFYVLCDDKVANTRCRNIRLLVVGPLLTMAFLNCILNPLIYAWWHKGFKNSLKKYYGEYFRNCFKCCKS